MACLRRARLARWLPRLQSARLSLHSSWCPAQRAGGLNFARRKIIMVRPSVNMYSKKAFADLATPPLPSPTPDTQSKHEMLLVTRLFSRKSMRPWGSFSFFASCIFDEITQFWGPFSENSAVSMKSAIRLTLYMEIDCFRSIWKALCAGLSPLGRKDATLLVAQLAL